MKKTASDQSEQKVLDDIAQHGYHVVHVLQDDEGPGFSYSVGLYATYKHPEIIFIGLKPDLAHLLISNMAYDIQHGKPYESSKMYPDILDDFECMILEVSKENYQFYVGFDIWYYEGTDFPLLQCIYPTVDGIFPWEDAWPEEIKGLQPVLGKI